MVIAPGNGYDRCFTAGFTPRAHAEECCRETHPDTALASENITFNLVLTSNLLMGLNFGYKTATAKLEFGHSDGYMISVINIHLYKSHILLCVVCKCALFCGRCHSSKHTHAVLMR